MTLPLLVTTPTSTGWRTSFSRPEVGSAATQRMYRKSGSSIVSPVAPQRGLRGSLILVTPS
eukprot:1425336-Heterocapsa_arctica.AAC.1